MLSILFILIVMVYFTKSSMIEQRTDLFRNEKFSSELHAYFMLEWVLYVLFVIKCNRLIIWRKIKIKSKFDQKKVSTKMIFMRKFRRTNLISTKTDIYIKELGNLIIYRSTYLKRQLYQ